MQRLKRLPKIFILAITLILVGCGADSECVKAVNDKGVDLAFEEGSVVLPPLDCSVGTAVGPLSRIIGTTWRGKCFTEQDDGSIFLSNLLFGREVTRNPLFSGTVEVTGSLKDNKEVISVDYLFPFRSEIRSVSDTCYVGYMMLHPSGATTMSFILDFDKSDLANVARSLIWQLTESSEQVEVLEDESSN